MPWAAAKITALLSDSRSQTPTTSAYGSQRFRLRHASSGSSLVGLTQLSLIDPKVAGRDLSAQLSPHSFTKASPSFPKLSQYHLPMMDSGLTYYRLVFLPRYAIENARGRSSISQLHRSPLFVCLLSPWHLPLVHFPCHSVEPASWSIVIFITNSSAKVTKDMHDGQKSIVHHTSQGPMGVEVGGYPRRASTCARLPMPTSPFLFVWRISYSDFNSTPGLPLTAPASS